MVFLAKKQKNGEESYKSIRLQKYMGRFQELYGIELMCWFGFQPIPNISEKVSTGRNRVRTVDGFKLRGGHQHRLSFRIYIYIGQNWVPSKKWMVNIPNIY